MQRKRCAAYSSRYYWLLRFFCLLPDFRSWFVIVFPWVLLRRFYSPEHAHRQHWWRIAKLFVLVISQSNRTQFNWGDWRKQQQDGKLIENSTRVLRCLWLEGFRRTFQQLIFLFFFFVPHINLLSCGCCSTISRPHIYTRWLCDRVRYLNVRRQIQHVYRAAPAGKCVHWIIHLFPVRPIYVCLFDSITKFRIYCCDYSYTQPAINLTCKCYDEKLMGKLSALKWSKEKPKIKLWPRALNCSPNSMPSFTYRLEHNGSNIIEFGW